MSRSSRRYWEERGAELEKLVDEGCRVTSAELGKLYDGALQSINERIRRLYKRFADGYGVTPGEVEALLSAPQTRREREELRKLLEQCDDPDLRAELLRRLDAPAYGYRISRLEALRDQVYFDAKAVGVKEIKYDRGRLDVYKTAYYRTAFNLSQSVGHNVPFEHISDRRAARAIAQYWTPDPKVLGWNFSERVWGNTTELAENVREIVTEGLMTGGNYRDMAARLQAQMGDVSARKVIQPDGSARTVLTGSGAKYRATRLIRTEGNHITGQAVLESYEDAGIEKYLFRSLLELRTCRRCGELDGKRFPVKEQQVGVNMHPMHPNCRCFVVPDEPDEDLKDFTRSAQTGADNWEPVPADMTWEEWRKKYVEGKNGGEQQRLTPKVEPPEQLKIDGWKDTKPIAKPDESVILKEEEDYTAKPITQESIDVVPKVKPPWWDDASAERLQAAHKELLLFVKDEPVGTEAAFVLSMDGKVEERVMGEMGKVAPPILNKDNIVIHNHPHCGPLSHMDIQKFIWEGTVQGITAVGNDGNICGLFKKTEFDGYMALQAYLNRLPAFEMFVRRKDSIGYIAEIESLLREVSSCGAEFIQCAKSGFA